MLANRTPKTMKLTRKLLASGLCALGLSVVGCGESGTTVAPIGVGTVAIAPQPLTVAAGTTVTFNCASSVTASAGCDWTLYGGDGRANVGSPVAAKGINSFQYTAPASPPIYTTPGAIYSQGVVTLETYYGYAAQTINIAITTPSVSVGIIDPVSSVSLGGSATLTAYAVGNLNNHVIWQVNGVTGGSSATGTILTPNDSSVAIYSAPTATPMSGSSVTITAVSKADPTKTSSTTITLH
jgi:hypothetical protein